MWQCRAGDERRYPVWTRSTHTYVLDNTQGSTVFMVRANLGSHTDRSAFTITEITQRSPSQSHVFHNSEMSSTARVKWNVIECWGATLTVWGNKTLLYEIGTKALLDSLHCMLYPSERMWMFCMLIETTCYHWGILLENIMQIVDCHIGGTI